jgi:hypothetical protein
VREGVLLTPDESGKIEKVVFKGRLVFPQDKGKRSEDVFPPWPISRVPCHG